MYMNCALVNINNPNKSVRILNTPEIFKANIGRYGDYATVLGADVTFPNPGESRDESMGDRRLHEPVSLEQGPVRLPDPAPEVGTTQQPSVPISRADPKFEAYRLNFMIITIILTSIVF